MVLLLSIYFAFSIVAAILLSGPENQWWYFTIAVQYALLLIDEVVPNWPIVGGDDGLPKPLLGVILFAALPPVLGGALGVSPPPELFGFWAALTIPLFIIQGRLRNDKVNQAKMVLLTIPLLMAVASYAVYNPALLLQSESGIGDAA